MNEEHLKEKLFNYDKRIDNHGDRIDKLEQENVGLKMEIKNLCENIKQLTSTMKWFITALGGALVSFFFYAVQSNIFK
ncbi:hemolysin XhlA family protein [Clostridium paraputrificum]|uniref:hemolysin XhlA family protein n=1 Tax=Clostridium paraputrificum TaxID=29363 RepID=UPI003D331031